MEIDIGCGIENGIKFGLTEHQVEKILGKPDKISKTMYTDAVAWVYNAHRITVYFDNGPKCLFDIDICADEIILYDVNIKEMTQKDYVKLLKRQGFKKLRYENYGYFKEVYCSAISVYGYFEFDRLTEVTITTLFNKDGNEIWPEDGVYTS